MTQILQKITVPVVLAGAIALSGCGNKADRHLSRGDRFKEAGDYAAAEVEYLAGRNAQPSDTRLMTRLGILYEEQGRVGRALQVLTRIEGATNDPNVQLALAKAYLHAETPPLARVHAARVLELSPTNQEAMVFLAKSSLGESAADSLEKLTRLPSAAQSLPGYHTARAELLARTGSEEQARVELQKALSLDPKYPWGHMLNSQLLFKQDRAAALRSLKSAQEDTPLRSRFRTDYALLLALTGSTNQAVSALQDLTSRAPDFLPAWTELARVQGWLRNYPAALSAVDQALQLDDSRILYLFKGRLMLAAGKPEALAFFKQLDNGLQQWNSRSSQRNTAGTNQPMAGDVATNAVPQAAPRLATWRPLDFTHDLFRAHILAGDRNGAVEVLEDWLQRAPTDLTAQLLRTELHVEGAPAEAALAERNMKGLLEANPELDSARLLLVKALIKQAKLEPALQELEVLMKKYPEDSRFPFAAADVHVLAGEALKARQMYDQAIAVARKRAETVQDDSSWLRVYSIYERARNAALRGGGTPSPQDLEHARSALERAVDLSANPVLVFDLADFYMRNGQPEKAREIAERTPGTNAEPAVLVRLGVLQLKLKEYPQAVKTLESALQAGASQPEVLNELAVVYTDHLANLDRALEVAQKAREMAPGNPAIADTLGWVLLKRGNAAGALPLLEQAAGNRALAENVEVKAHYGIALAMAGEESLAREHLQLVLKEPADRAASARPLAEAAMKVLSIQPDSTTPEDVRFLEQHLAQAPNDCSALLRLAVAAEKNRAFDKASDYYSRIAGLARSGPRRAEALTRLARIHSTELNTPDRALQFAKDALAADPRNPEAMRLAGKLAFESGDYRYATALLEQSARESADPQVRHQLAWALYSVGRLADAGIEMRKLLSDASAGDLTNNAARFLTLVQAATNGTNAASQLPLAEQTLAENPKHVPAAMVKAVALEQRNDPRGAAQLYEAVLAQYPLFTPAMRNLALLYFDALNEPRKAETLARQAREALPDDPRLTEILGVLAFRAEDYSRAAQYFQLLQNSSASPDPKITYYLGMSYYRLRELPRSKEYLSRAAADPALDAKLAQEAKGALGQIH